MLFNAKINIAINNRHKKLLLCQCDDPLRCDYFIMITEKQCIMVVDDDEHFLSNLSSLLVKFGYEVMTAPNGMEALTKLKHQPCNLVIADMKMPEINGIELLKEIRRADIRTEFILMTAYGEVNSYLDAMNLGAFEYLNKPVKSDELKMTISRALERAENSNGEFAP